MSLSRLLRRWGSTWPGRTPSAVTTALGREAELEMHLRGALRNDLASAEIPEVLLLHAAVYARSAGRQRCHAVAQRVLDGDSSTGSGYRETTPSAKQRALLVELSGSDAAHAARVRG
jgi:hypothetical protein